MRLLNTYQLTFYEVFDDPPPYAVLSHTWDYGQEVSFQEMQAVISMRGSERSDTSELAAMRVRSGYQKILSCCEKAREEGLRYCWIDTVCINKESSSELSEAINSMYHYYASSEVCFVYLADFVRSENVDDGSRSVESWVSRFKRCRWLYRAWTLQELVAPRNLCFYNQEWLQIGSLHRGTPDLPAMAVILAQLTDIDLELLAGRKQLEDFSIAQKLSWAAPRSASRVEDESYSLLGILGVNMPLLYGEREQAFFRLQKELLESSDDQTLFAWSTIPSRRTRGLRRFGGFLASSPKAFLGAGSIVRARLAMPTHSPYHWTNRGLRITLNIDQRPGSPAVGAAVAVLDCVSTSAPKQPLGILVSILDIADPSKHVETSTRNKKGYKLSSSQENFNVYRYLQAQSPMQLASFGSRKEMAQHLVPVLVHVPQHLSASHTASLQRRSSSSATVEDFDRGILSMTTISVLLLPLGFIVNGLLLERTLGVPYHLLTVSFALVLGAIFFLPRDSIIIRTHVAVWNALLRQR